MGVGALTSASIGEIIDANFAKKLQMPKAVPAKIVGNIEALARKHMLKLELIPNLARIMNPGMRLTCPEKLINRIEPITEMIEDAINTTLKPSF